MKTVCRDCGGNVEVVKKETCHVYKNLDKETISIMKDTLMFYADQANWDMKTLPDNGAIARGTLRQLGIAYHTDLEEQ